MIDYFIPAWKGEETLEDFNVRVLFDKLEDQNLHLSSQLTRHQEDLRAFYDRIRDQNDELKGMINDLDTSKIEELMSRAEAARAAGAGGAGAGGAGGGAGVTQVNANFTHGGTFC